MAEYDANGAELLTARETAEWLRISRQALWQRRKRRTGPPYIQWKGAVRYRKQDVEDWLLQHKETTDDE